MKHLVVIYDENVSFDHYFGTYPYALNPPGQPAFHAMPGTPTVAGLTPTLLSHNPNAANPHRLGPGQAVTCDNNHAYTAEQLAFDRGRLDRFVQQLGGESTAGCDPSTVMDYYDGNTVTALWNYAQRFAMSDASFDATFGPTLPGHLNLVAGQTRGEIANVGSTQFHPATVTTNLSAAFDDCATQSQPRVRMTSQNIGNLLDTADVSWGWFSAGFRPTSRRPNGTAICGATHINRAGKHVRDYFPLGVGEPFQYWSSTANPHHLPPRSLAEIGHHGPANHQYDLTDFWHAADAGRLPSVSFLKPPFSQSGHAGAESSDPLSEQGFLVDTINRLQRLPAWSSTAVVIAYDDSDGWYDHVFTPITNPSHGTGDQLDAPGQCGSGTALAGIQDRCGPGSRLPLLVLSPFAKRNDVDHTITTQVSVLRFIEDNWLRGQRLGSGSFDATAHPLTSMFDFGHPDRTPFLLDPTTGTPKS